MNKISRATGLSVSTIKNYIDGNTIPAKANLSVLERYFSEFSEKKCKNHISGNNNIIGDNSLIDFRTYYSDSPDVLRSQIDLLDERIKEKDAQIKEKDAQIKEKDAQIKELLAIIKDLSLSFAQCQKQEKTNLL